MGLQWSFLQGVPVAQLTVWRDPEQASPRWSCPDSGSPLRVTRASYCTSVNQFFLPVLFSKTKDCQSSRSVLPAPFSWRCPVMSLLVETPTRHLSTESDLSLCCCCVPVPLLSSSSERGWPRFVWETCLEHGHPRFWELCLLMFSLGVSKPLWTQCVSVGQILRPRSQVLITLQERGPFKV